MINVDHGHVGTRDRFDWMPGALEGIALATSRGWRVFVVTNQSGVARGLYTETELRALHDWMIREIAAAGGVVDDIRYCPYHPDAVIPRVLQGKQLAQTGAGDDFGPAASVEN